MVNTVADNSNNTVVIINTIGSRLLDQWIEHDNVTAVLYGSILGQESGNAIVDILYGDVNPSGRLIHTIAKNESDYNVGLCYTAQCNFTEGVYIDYRYFDAKNLTPRYPFGHGLSYTSFKTKAPNGNCTVGGTSGPWDVVGTVSARITNNGTHTGVGGFPAVPWVPQCSGSASCVARDISYWDVTAQEWLVAPGTYQVHVGASSRDLRLDGTFALRVKS
ncbi:glycoside hydrolase family 3 C-terminal domain-containing protein [Aspergillus saccharolyticus JOP 1030-1]|uniref:beta-glucosidase n=1 Tax=Aspergillus saccharolyticus JOP 1030-1 TaxID=1450539 RepID=A0A318Z882_9EURO|nr:hypothetical protein BP01DRAFT_385286 [Aspergillus saccharolyticus JOP 1030-1]PYH42627.1 hypothetical protein BP01DRAFT_385286 [Aspergillus saccharolyticus JOP 1030-1]